VATQITTGMAATGTRMIYHLLLNQPKTLAEILKQQNHLQHMQPIHNLSLVVAMHNNHMKTHLLRG
jgi:hypothetical protein